MAWADGVDMTSGLEDGDPGTHDWDPHASARPVAHSRTTPYDVEGMVRRLEGKTVVLLPRIDVLASGRATTLARRHLHMLCRVASSSTSIEHVQGDAHRDPVVRVSTLELVEEV